MVNLPLFLSDVGGSEIILILIVILLFFGSKSIPGIAKTMGKAVHQIKQASHEVQNEIKKSTGDIKTDFDLQKMVRETTDIVEKPLMEEAVKMDQIIQTPSEHSRPVGMINHNHEAPTLDQPLEEENSDLTKDQ